MQKYKTCMFLDCGRKLEYPVCGSAIHHSTMQPESEPKREKKNLDNSDEGLV